MTEEQITYVVTQLRAGHTKAAVREALEEAGYQNDTIEELFLKAEAEINDTKDDTKGVSTQPSENAEDSADPINKPTSPAQPAATDMNSSESIDHTENPKPNAAASGHKTLIILGIIFVVIVALGGVAYWYFVLSYSSSLDTTPLSTLERPIPDSNTETPATTTDTSPSLDDKARTTEVADTSSNPPSSDPIINSTSSVSKTQSTTTTNSTSSADSTFTVDNAATTTTSDSTPATTSTSTPAA